MALQFEYYYEQEAEMYNFYRIPKLLFTNEAFSWISCEAKILYGLMLDRMGLSIKNNWRDKAGRVYILYKIDSIAADLGCSVSKAVKVLSELDSVKGIGLIRKVKRGQGKADLIYVMNYLKTQGEDSSQSSTLVEPDNPKNYKSENAKNQNSKNENSEIKNSENQISANEKGFYVNSHDQNSENENSEISTSKVPIGRTLVFSNTVSNNTDKNNTDFNSYQINQNPDPTPTKKMDHMDNHGDKLSLSSSFLREKGQSPRCSVPEFPIYEGDDIFTHTQERIRSQIDYDYLIDAHPGKTKLIDELVSLMAEIITYYQGNIKINSQSIPVEAVKQRLLKHNMLTMEYVLETLSKTTTDVKNVRSYNLTVLYNAPVTQDSYYDAKYRHNQMEFAGQTRERA